MKMKIDFIQEIEKKITIRIIYYALYINFY